MGLIIAGLIGVIGIIMMVFTMKNFDNPGAGFILFFTALALGVIVGAIFHILGIVLSALGQILMAIADAAVNGSPFMTQEQKAQAMKLTK